MYIEYNPRQGQYVNKFEAFNYTRSNPPMYWSAISACVWFVPNTIDPLDG